MLYNKAEYEKSLEETTKQANKIAIVGATITAVIVLIIGITSGDDLSPIVMLIISAVLWGTMYFFISSIARDVIQNGKDKTLKSQNEDSKNKAESIFLSTLEKEKREYDLVDKDLDEYHNLYCTIDCNPKYGCITSKYAVLIDKKQLHFFFNDKTVDLEISRPALHINLDDILFFRIMGDVQRDTIVSGGGGQVGGSSIPGAIIGGVIAGPVGAVIGSRKQNTVSPITSEIKETDKRYIELYTKDTRYNFYFGTITPIEKGYDVLRKLLPSKDYESQLLSKKN